MGFPVPLLDNPKAISFAVILLFMFLYYQTRVLHVETSSLRKLVGSVARGVSEVAQSVASRAEPVAEDRYRQQQPRDDLPFPYNQQEAPYDHYEADVVPQFQRSMSVERPVRDERKVASERPPPQQMQQPEETGRQGTNRVVYEESEKIRKPSAQNSAAIPRTAATMSSGEEDCFGAEFGGCESRYK
jgi:hypothetical protein